jgi:hypothetical protein
MWTHHRLYFHDLRSQLGSNMHSPKVIQFRFSLVTMSIMKQCYTTSRFKNSWLRCKSQLVVLVSSPIDKIKTQRFKFRFLWPKLKRTPICWNQHKNQNIKIKLLQIWNQKWNLEKKNSHTQVWVLWVGKLNFFYKSWQVNKTLQAR